MNSFLTHFHASLVADFQSSLAEATTCEHRQESLLSIVNAFEDGVSGLNLAFCDQSGHRHGETDDVREDVLVVEHETLNSDAAAEDFRGGGDAVLFLRRLVVL